MACKKHFYHALFFGVVSGAAIALTLLTACQREDAPQQQPERPNQAGTVELMLHCGAGIRPAASALIEAFEERCGIKVNANYAGGGRLLGQISAMQKGDLFMPGAEMYVDMAIAKGLADESSKRTVGYFVPVLFVQKGNPRNISSVADLKRDGLRLGLGEERSCAVGGATLEILNNYGIAPAEIEKNVVYKSGTVNELGVAVQLRTVDAVVLWDASARHFADSGTAIPIPPEKNSISVIPIVALKCSEDPHEAALFIDFITSEAGRGILRRTGYTVSLPDQEPALSD